MSGVSIGSFVHSFFVDHLDRQRRLRPATIRSYRDTLRLFLAFVAHARGRKITSLSLEDLTFERVLEFLAHLEKERGNHIRTRNQRLAALHGFFVYLAQRRPELLETAERVAAIRPKRVAPPDPHHLEREQVVRLFESLDPKRRHYQRDYALLLFLYNTGARAQEAADLRVREIDLGERPRVHLHGKGDKWRSCPLWRETAEHVRELLQSMGTDQRADAPVFSSQGGEPLSRFGIYKIVRRHAGPLETPERRTRAGRITPHVFRHTTAVHLLESGVEVNVIRAWLGHVSLETTNRYAEIPARLKEEAVELCSPPVAGPAGNLPRKPRWQTDEALLTWLASL